MGSSLSGRQNGKPLIEDCLTIDLARLMRLGPIREGQIGAGEIRWSVGGQKIGEIRFWLDFRQPDEASLILYFYACQPDGDRKAKKQTIRLTETRQRLGGRRWWLCCPTTGKRVRTLHLPPNGNRFASREAWGLAYRVERLSRFDRPFEKIFRVQRRLGQPQGLGIGIERPKGMWHRTYIRRVERFILAEAECAGEIALLIGRA